MDEVLVIDIGGTKTNVSLLSSSDLNAIKVIKSEIFKTSLDPAHTIEKISAICSDWQKIDTRLDQMSLSLPGLWDKDGVLQQSVSLCTWLKYPFVQDLASKLKIRNFLWETDVICGALGEYHFGVGAKCGKSLLYINLGTGIGAALIRDGKPYKSNVNLTLRMHKLVLPLEDELVSGVDLLTAKGLLEFSKHSSIESLYKSYKMAEVEAFNIISKAQIQLAAWLINLFYLFAPDLIVLNGGLTYEREVLSEGAIEIANEELEGQVEILGATLKELAPVYGAYVNFIRQ